MNVEYRVRPVTRFVVTRWYRDDNGSGGTSEKGEYPNHNMAYEVGYALCRAEHEVLGWPLGDTRIQYPKPALDSEPIQSAIADLGATDVMITAGAAKLTEMAPALSAGYAEIVVTEIYAAMRAANERHGAAIFGDSAPAGQSGGLGGSLCVDALTQPRG